MPYTPLSEAAEFAFPTGAFDVRGWEVRTMVDGEKAGDVEDILIDDHGAPRYLEVALEDSRKHILVPVGQARVDEAQDLVWVPGMTREQLERVPAYAQDAAAITATYEARLDEAYSPSGRTGDAGVEGGAWRVESDGGSGHARELARLSELKDYRVAEGDPDPRGWEVIGLDGLRTGRVGDLVVDTEHLKVRYLECAVGDHGRDGGESRRVLIPIGFARLDEVGEVVLVDAIPSWEIESLPEFRELPRTREAEARLFERFTRGGGDTGSVERPGGSRRGVAGVRGWEGGDRRWGGGRGGRR